MGCGDSNNLCDTCHAGCCRSYAVPLTGADIIRIEQDLNLSFWDFACRWEDAEGRISGNHAPQIYFKDEPETPFVICLSHTQSHFRKNTDKCRFLMESQPDEKHPLGVARCSIYQSRPSTCRAFPTKLNQTGELAILSHVPESGRAGNDPIYNLCPEQWKPDQIDPIRSVQDLVVAQHEINFFRQLVESWNHNPQKWEFFPEFLHLVYSQRVQLESSLDESIPISQDETESMTIPFPTLNDQTQARRAA